MTVAVQAECKPLYVHNRKYIGSKYHLLSFIEQVVAQVAPEATSIADLFCGSGVVAHQFAARGFTVMASDALYHNYLAASCFLGGRPGQVSWERMGSLVQTLDGLPGTPGYCHGAFGGTYFTHENATRIDAVRQQIADWVGSGFIGAQEEAVLLTSLLYAVDKVANTCGQYDAYLKHLGGPPYSIGGVHQVDACVYKPLELGLPQVVESVQNTVWCGDANELVARAKADILYLDPPYNGRQYVDNYHVLENIARWERPSLTGKTRKFDRTHLKSDYSRKRLAAQALGELVRKAQCRYIVLSYNNEGIIPDETLIAILEQRGKVELYTQPYAIFGKGAGRSGRRAITERLFCCTVSG